MLHTEEDPQGQGKGQNPFNNIAAAFQQMAKEGEGQRAQSLLEFVKECHLGADQLEKLDDFARINQPNGLIHLAQMLIEQMPAIAQGWGAESSFEMYCELTNLMLDLVGTVEPVE